VFAQDTVEREDQARHALVDLGAGRRIADVRDALSVALVDVKVAQAAAYEAQGEGAVEIAAAARALGEVHHDRERSHQVEADEGDRALLALALQMIEKPGDEEASGTREEGAKQDGDELRIDAGDVEDGLGQF